MMCVYIYTQVQNTIVYRYVPRRTCIQVWDVETGKCLLTLVNTAGAAAATATTTVTAIAPATNAPAEEASPTTCTTAFSPPRVRTARLAVSRCGRLVAFGNGRQIKVLDFDRLADRSEATGRPGRPGTYLAQALRFVVSPTT